MGPWRLEATSRSPQGSKQAVGRRWRMAVEQTKWHGAAGYRSVRGRTKASTGKHARRMHAHAWPDQTGQRDRSMRTALDMMAPASSTSFHAVSGVLAGAAQQRDGSLAKSYGRSRKFRTNLLKARRRKKVAKTNSPGLLTATPDRAYYFLLPSADHIYSQSRLSFRLSFTTASSNI